MPFVRAENVVAAHIRYTLFSQLLENTLYFQTASNPTEGNIVTLAAGLMQQWIDEVMPLLTADLTLREVYAVSLDAIDAPTATATPGAGPVAGGVSNPGMPGNVTLCISFRSGFRGRSRRGRIYLPGLYETATQGNAVLTTFSTAVVNAVGTAITALDPEGFSHVIVSKFTEGIPRGEALVTPVTAYVLTDDNVDSQRRRLVGRGR